MPPIPKKFYSLLKSLKPELAKEILNWLSEAKTTNDIVVKMGIPLCAAIPDEPEPKDT